MVTKKKPHLPLEPGHFNEQKSIIVPLTKRLSSASRSLRSISSTDIFLTHGGFFDCFGGANIAGWPSITS